MLEGRTEVTERQGGRRKQLLDDLTANRMLKTETGST